MREASPSLPTSLPITATLYATYSQRTRALLSWRAQKRAGIEKPCCCFEMTDAALAPLTEDDLHYVWGTGQ